MITHPQTLAGKMHHQVAGGILNASHGNLTYPQYMDQVTGGVVGAAAAGSIGGPIAAAVGGVIGGAVAHATTTSGKDVLSIVDEMGAFYGMLDVRVRTNAHIRAAQSLAMFWAAALIATAGMAFYTKVRGYLGETENDGRFYRVVEWLRILQENSGSRLVGKNILFGAVEADLAYCQTAQTQETCNQSMRDPFNPLLQSKCAWTDLSNEPGGTAGGKACRPPSTWYDYYGKAFMGKLNKVSDNLLSLTIKAGKTDETQAVSTFDIRALFEDTASSAAYFVILSMIVYLAAYTTGRYYGGMIRGRCENDPHCEKRMIRLSSHIQDRGRLNTTTLWNPLASGTMGWLIAQSLLGVSFL
jgi:hypothetical protein